MQVIMVMAAMQTMVTYWIYKRKPLTEDNVRLSFMMFCVHIIITSVMVGIQQEISGAIIIVWQMTIMHALCNFIYSMAVEKKM